MALREIPPLARKQEYDIPPAWSGTQSQGLPKTVVFVLRLAAGEHTLNFVPYRGAEILAEPQVKLVADPRSWLAVANKQAEENDRRPWQMIALINLPLKSISLDATAEWRWRDSDDLKLIVDGVVKPNPSWLAILRKDWLLSGSLLKWLRKSQQQHFAFEENLPVGIHYIELWTDRQPRVHVLKLDLGEVAEDEAQPEEPPTEEPAQRVPTVDDPEWTGDFEDDTEQMILARVIFGEARDSLLSDKVRIGIGWSIRRRVEDNRWGATYNDVITQPSQYSALNEDDDNREYVEDPLHRNDQLYRIMWRRCYEIAGKVIAGELPDPVDGANHYYDISIDEPWWASQETFVIQIDTVRFYKL